MPTRRTVTALAAIVALAFAFLAFRRLQEHAWVLEHSADWGAVLVASVDVFPFAVLAWLAATRHVTAPWLALGAPSAALDLGWSGWPGLYEETDLAALAVAVTASLAWAWIARERMHWRWRVTAVSLGAALQWVPLHAAMAGYASPWGSHPAIVVILLAAGVAGVALLRGRAWAVLALSVLAIALLALNVPAPIYSTCSGPVGHPYGFTCAAGFTALCLLGAVAPWLTPVVRALGPQTVASPLARGAARDRSTDERRSE